MEDEDLPLPNLEEVLICSSTTTTEEVCFLALASYNIRFAIVYRYIQQHYNYSTTTCVFIFNIGRITLCMENYYYTSEFPL